MTNLKYILTALLITLTISGCGGGGGGGSSLTASSSTGVSTFTVVDPYIKNARFFLG